MIKRYILCGIVLCFFGTSYAQTDSIKTSRKLFLKKEIVPLSLIGAGIYVNYAGNSFGKVPLQNNIQKGLKFQTRVDDYLQFAPIGVLGFADILGLKTTNNIKTQAKNIALITASNYVIVKSIKLISNETRPNGSKQTFPSGHTSNAFAMAGILRHELKGNYPVLSYSGYLFASTTGVFRVLNNKHWVSDVLVGAGIGMLVSDIVYRLQSNKNHKIKRQKNLNAIFVPTVKQNQLGFSGILYF
jgi:PAP2 superfamily